MGTFNKLKEVQEKREAAKKQRQPVPLLRNTPSGLSAVMPITPAFTRNPGGSIASLPQSKSAARDVRLTEKTDSLPRHSQELKEAKRAQDKPFVFPVHPMVRDKRIMAFVLFVLLVLGFNVKLLFLSWDSSRQSDKAFTRMAEVKSAVDVTSRKVNDLTVTTQRVTESLERVSSRVDDTDNKVRTLTDTTETQQAAIENLTKAKNAAFNRLSNLEAEVESLKKAATSKSSVQE